MRRRAGFTLIELMIVVAIIGILAAIAIPKFAELIRKSTEGQAKGQLGAIRSALSIYYGDMEGNWPTNLTSLTIGGKYLSAIPRVKVPNYHADTSVVRQNTGATDIFGCNGGYSVDFGQWTYWNDDGTMCGGMAPPAGQRARTQGEVWVGCSHTDTKGSQWSQY